MPTIGFLRRTTAPPPYPVAGERPMVGAPSGGGGARDGQGQRGEWRLNFGG
ncbi:hypothetical protein F383_15352 [Gossypium arboreum]|uniref:Uncharacterized protein n=1 Tax=Gossypium arboreum TaxID=29729 RepID=A0A0B0PXY1_GOSAR|nr:hypothetical protein F383_15352 [Gossypium arboreum]